MKTPIFIYEPDDLIIFETIADAQSYLEAPDIVGGIYKAFDAEGRLLRLNTTNEKKMYRKKIIIDAAEASPTHICELEEILKSFLVDFGCSADWSLNATLYELVRKIKDLRLFTK